MSKAGLFTNLYGWVISQCQKKYSRLTLFILSFMESSFFLIPPDVMLLPMVLADRSHYRLLALITTVGSVLGGLLGYAIGALLYGSLGTYILELYNLEERFLELESWYSVYGTWAVLIAAFTPFPYKLITIFSGIAGLNIIFFLGASIVGRGVRFFFVAYIGAMAQPVIEERMRKYFEQIGWAICGVCAAFGLWLLL